MAEQELKYKIREEIERALNTYEVGVDDKKDGSIVATIVRHNFGSSDLEKLEYIAKKHNLNLNFFVSPFQWYWILIECTFGR
jgi:hypothetical protein